MQGQSMRTVAFYIRVSTERQAKVEEGSLKNQEQMLRAEVERRNVQTENWGTFVDAYVDEGLSGKNTNRPAFQRMLQDVEIGRIDTVLFTELSRLSRSLKDFLNIFEFAQKHQCDLICLKTDIDTTSPYKSLITKILMIFAEFEREMTSRRTSLNAYERSKRGLANGGQAPLGFRRDKKRKGYLLVDPKEKEIVRDIFTTYLTAHSIKRTAELIRSRYGDTHPRAQTISCSKIYSILTNKTYIGIREINKHNGAPSEEVPAVWEPIIEAETFSRVQEELKKNRNRFHSHAGDGRYVYLFSGLFRCGACGQKLHGKSAWSTNHKRHRYYSHRSTCPKNGHNQIRADLTHTLVLDWLRDIADNGERFEKLREEGVKRIERRIVELRRAIGKTEDEICDLTDQIEARIDALTKATDETIRRTVEESIVGLSAQKDEKKELRAYTEHEINRLETLKTEKNIYVEYQSRVRTALKAIDAASGTPAAQQKAALREILASMTLHPDHIKTALSGVNLKGPVSAAFVVAPPV